MVRTLYRHLFEGDVSEGESVVMEGIQAVRAGVLLKPLNTDAKPNATRG